MVANLGYLRQVTGDTAPNVVFAKASGDPVALSRRIAAATARDGVSVANILVGLAAAVVLGGVVSSLGASVAVRRLPLASILREE